LNQPHLYALSAAASAISKKLSDISREPSIIERTLQLKPDFAEAHLLAGNILLRLNQLQRAQVEYEEYLHLAPKGEDARSSSHPPAKASKHSARTEAVRPPFVP